VTHCYSTGSVSGGSYVGGLVGSNGGSPRYYFQAGTVTYSYSTGLVSGTSYVGGLVAQSAGGVAMATCFWDTHTSGQATSAGGTGKTTAEMQTARTFLPWATCGNEGIWTIDGGRDYPRLWWQNRPGAPITLAPSLRDLLIGEGTEQSPYLIHIAEELNLLGLFPCDWDKHFKLMADIDLSALDGKEGRPAFNIIAPDADPSRSGFQGTPFTGVFDGNSRTISHLTITSVGYLGLFGCLETGTEVKNLGVVDINIVGSASYVDGLVGSNSSWNTQGGSVTNCYSTGVIRGTGSEVGGLVGYNWAGRLTQCHSTAWVSGCDNVGGLVGSNVWDYDFQGGTLIQCYSAGAVNGNDNVGGLVGRNHSGVVSQCYSTGAVNGTDDVGGLVGYNYGSITTSYSTGTVDGNDWVGGLIGYTEDGIIRDCYSMAGVAGRNGVGGLIGASWGECDWDGSCWYPDISRCYSAGPVTGETNVGALIGVTDGEVLACFWDTQSSGQATSAGGTGKTTAEMQKASTFLDAGWDFMGETKNGTADTWWILEGKGYPFFAPKTRF